MMYEIYLEPKGGSWRIRIVTLTFWFFSKSETVTVRVLGDGPTASFEPLEFDTYDEAMKHVVDTGIDKAYRQVQRAKGYLTWVHATGGNPTCEEVAHA